MNKKYLKALFCILLIVVMCASTQLVYARAEGGNLSISDEAKAEEAYYLERGGRTLEELDENIDWAKIMGVEPQISPRWLCRNCGWMCQTVCAADALVSNKTYYHDTLFTKDCKITIIKSRGAWVCDFCYSIDEWFDYHVCWEIHSKCSKGKYDVCTMNIS